MISIAAPEIGKEEVGAVNEVLASGMLAQGPKVAELETAFADYCGTKYAVAVNSGTAALHSALFAAGIQAGDEVITTPFSFVATINSILFLGAKPVLVDIDPDTYNIDTGQLENVITSKTKAILPVHLYGQPCDYTELEAVAKKHNLLVIEDACQAIGALYGSKKAGNLGDMGCFSLYATKNIMCGEGGVVTTNSKEFAEDMKHFRQHGMTGPYQYAHLGYNYRMSDLHAAIAVEQLKKVERFTAARQKTARIFDAGLKDIDNIDLPKVAANRTHVYHQYTIRLKPNFPLSRHEFVEAMHKKEIGVGVYYSAPLHTIPHVAKFGYSVGDFPITERATEEVVSLPVHPKVSEADANRIVTAIQELARV